MDAQAGQRGDGRRCKGSPGRSPVEVKDTGQERCDDLHQRHCEAGPARKSANGTRAATSAEDREPVRHAYRLASSAASTATPVKAEPAEQEDEEEILTEIKEDETDDDGVLDEAAWPTSHHDLTMQLAIQAPFGRFV